MKEDLSQIFYVPIGKGKINLHTGQRGGYYLPALEPKYEEAPPGAQPPDPQWRRDQWEYVRQLRAQVIHQQKRISELEKKGTLDTKPLIKPTYKDVTV